MNLYKVCMSIVILFVYGCSTTSVSTPTNVSSTAQTPVKILDKISFFAWDGIENYQELNNRIDGYENPVIYLNPVDNGEYKFEENAQELHSVNLKVWYLMSGDGNDSRYPTLDYVQDQVDKIVEYNQNHTQQVLGMSFDVEPWVDFEEQNSSDNQDDWQEYLDFMSEARDILHDKGLKISIAIPFWIDRQTEAFPNDRPINYDVIDIADEVIVMTYTVFAERIEPYAKTSLEYANSHHKDIKIALEMSQNDQEENVSFYTHPEDIKDVLDMHLEYETFRGYMIHTLKSFLESGIDI